MAETRAQIAYHFKFDPAQEIVGPVRMPEMVSRTIAVGNEVIPEKVASSSIPEADRTALLIEMEKQVREATRKAKPVGETDNQTQEISAF
ncbi:hypothetical protein [uncultured Desulfuromusa sp.]|uniref:hypothetical protein n=1 Tax=uncultured Desulfuromusa sp. TaxID=219183 RepID=UPI002AA7648D|nr:hypothetical protein [uncultured Desulfuromusa sp.]